MARHLVVAQTEGDGLRLSGYVDGGGSEVSLEVMGAATGLTSEDMALLEASRGSDGLTVLECLRDIRGLMVAFFDALPEPEGA